MSESWSTLPPIPKSLDEVACGRVNGTFYVIGGGIGNVYALNLTTNTWTTLAPRPLVGNHHTMEVIDDKLFVLGALGPGANRVQIYNVRTNTWTFGPNMTWAVDGSGVSATINGIIYFCGGILGGSTITTCGRLDPVALKWTLVASMPLGRNHAAGGTDGSKLYVFGGRTGGNSVGNGFADVQIYNPATNTWASSSNPADGIPAMPIPRGGTGHAAFVPHRREVYIMGGETQNGVNATTNHVFARIDAFHVDTKTWRTLSLEMPTPRHGIYPLAIPPRGNLESQTAVRSILVAGGGTQAGFSVSAVVEEMFV